MKEFNNLIIKEETDINRELFKKHFGLKKNDLVNVIKSGLSDLKNEIEEMSENEIEIEQTNKRVVDFVEKILDFNNQNQE